MGNVSACHSNTYKVEKQVHAITPAIPAALTTLRSISKDDAIDTYTSISDIKIQNRSSTSIQHIVVQQETENIALSDFHLVHVIGKGGFGRVWQAVHKTTGRVVAIKQVSKAMILKSDNRVKMIHNERYVMINAAMKQCTFLSPLLYAFHSAQDLYFVMDYLNGGDLRYHICEKSLLTLAELKQVACELLCGIHELHQMNVIYRDCKPENILINNNKHIQLVDFGLSVLLPNNDSTVAGKIGTTAYQAPEVVCNRPYGFEIDWWAYAVTLYELYHGRRPWNTEQLQVYEYAVSTNVYTTQLPDMCDFHLSSQCTPELRSLLRELLHTDIHKRLCKYEDIIQHPYFKDVNWSSIQYLTQPGILEPKTTDMNYDVTLNDTEQHILANTIPDYIQPQHRHIFDQWHFDSTQLDEFYINKPITIPSITPNTDVKPHGIELRIDVNSSCINENSADIVRSPTRAQRISIQSQMRESANALKRHSGSPALTPIQHTRINTHGRTDSNSLLLSPGSTRHSYSIRSPRASYGVTQLSRASFSNTVSPIQSPSSAHSRRNTINVSTPFRTPTITEQRIRRATIDVQPQKPMQEFY